MTNPARHKRQKESSDDTTQNIIDWVQINSKLLSIVGAVVLVVGVGIWFYARSTQIQAANASRQLVGAKQSLAAGNLPLTQTDLQRIIARYPGTAAGVEGAMLLAQIEYDQGRYQEGIDALRQASGRRAAAAFQPAIRSLIGDGLLQLGRPAEAGAAYEEAASSAARFPHERAHQRAKAARSYTAAGDTVRARQIWSELAEERASEPIAAEARIRLGELNARPATGS